MSAESTHLTTFSAETEAEIRSTSKETEREREGYHNCCGMDSHILAPAGASRHSASGIFFVASLPEKNQHTTHSARYINYQTIIQRGLPRPGTEQWNAFKFLSYSKQLQATVHSLCMFEFTYTLKHWRHQWADNHGRPWDFFPGGGKREWPHVGRKKGKGAYSC